MREMAPAQPKPREGLRISTLVIAAVASGAAAVIVSHVWTRGTIVASAMTPVFVALVSELLRKPVESEMVRKPIRVARSAVTSNVPVTFERRDHAGQRVDEGASASDVRIYSTGSDRARTKPRRNLRLKVALITGLVAFLIAAAFLTLPEVIFGGSVTGGHRTTTYFGGGSSSSSKSTKSDSSSKSSSKDSTNNSTSTDQTTTGQTTTSPGQTTTGQTTSPGQTTTQQTTQQQAPPNTTTPPTQPVPTTPTPTTPTP